MRLTHEESMSAVLKSHLIGPTGWTIGVREFDSRRDGWKFSFLHGVQNGSGAHLASYPMDTGGSFSGGKAART
jgi:hypothetical protein